MEKRRDLFPRLAQGASFFFLAACLSVTYECVQIHDAKSGLSENPLDSVTSGAVTNPNSPEAAAEDDILTSIGNLFGVGDGKKKEPNKEPETASKPPAVVTNPPVDFTPKPTPYKVVATKVEPLDFNFLDSNKPAGLEAFTVTQRITGTKAAYNIVLNPGWGEQTRTLVDKSFYHEKGINLFIFADKPDVLSAVRADKYQENYAQQEVDKIAATHPMLIPFKFEQEVRSFRHRHWGSFRFVHNGITKLILYTHAGKNGKYSIVISSQKDLLLPEMKKVWMMSAENFEVDLEANPEDDTKKEEPKPEAP